MKWLLVLIAVVALARIVAHLLRQQRSEQDGSASTPAPGSDGAAGNVGTPADTDGWMRQQIDQHAAPASIDGMDAYRLRTAMQPLIDALQAFQSGDDHFSVFGMFVREQLATDLARDYAEPLAAALAVWQDALEKAHGATGLAFFADVTFSIDVPKRGTPRTGKRAGSLTPDPVPVDYADALAHAVAEGEATLEKEGERLVAARLHFGWDSEGPDPAAAFAAIVEGERGQTLERLTLGIFQADENDYAPVFAALAAGPELPRLRELFIGDYEYPDETEISWTSVGDFGPLWSKLPALESLRLRGGGIALGEATHESLRSLILETGGLPDAAVRSLAAGRFPRLETLEIWLGTDEYGGDSSIETLKPLLQSQNFPALRHLGLRNAEYTDAIAAAVLEAPLLNQLETIDLSMGMLSDDGAAALTAAADRLRHLKKLNVGDNYVGESAAAALIEALGEHVEVGTQKEPDVYDDETYRYVTVGE